MAGPGRNYAIARLDGFALVWIAAVFLAVSLTGCATPRLVAVPDGSARVSPGGRFATLEREGLAIQTVHADTPYRLDRNITTIEATLINRTDAPIDFYPRPYTLFDQNGRQHTALGPGALAEAAATGVWGGYSSVYAVGPGFHHPHWGYSYHFYDPYPFYRGYWSRPPYEALIASALPYRPITVYPQASVTGNLYFAVPPKELESAKLVVARFAEAPRKDAPPPREIVYEFHFAAAGR